MPNSNEINQQPVVIHKIDLSTKVMGRIATRVADLLRGKNKANFSYNKVMGDQVIAYNAKKIVLTGNKKEQILYHQHSGYPGHLKTLTFRQIMEKDPTRIFKHAVMGMLPKNRLRKLWLKNLTIYSEEINE